MCTLVVDLGKEPIQPLVGGKEDGVLVSWLLLQLDGNRNKLATPIHIEEAHGSWAELAITGSKSFHDLQVANIDVSSLWIVAKRND